MSIEHVHNLIIGSGVADTRSLRHSVAAGRSPNTERLGADRAGVELDARDYIRVNDRLQTSAPDVWATGECAGSPQFTHVGEDDGRIVVASSCTISPAATGPRAAASSRTACSLTRSWPTLA